MKMIAKFSKTGDLKFCSHLDLQKLFMRAVARAGIPVEFSKGFNRHPNISIAMALGVGQESISEYMEVELSEEISKDVFQRSMNGALPIAVQILDCRFIEGKMPPLMSLVYAAKYEITFKDTINLKEKTCAILNESVIMIEKKTKTKTALTDIRPLILDLEAAENKLICLVRCGQVNLKPRDLISLYGNDLNCNIMRTSLMSLKEDGTRLVELMDT